jgi:FkbM family methyltransferase
MCLITKAGLSERSGKRSLPLEEATLIDCGADIGTFSVLASFNSKIGRIIAFEPNADVTDVLRENLSRLLLASEVIGKAVSNFVG